MKCEIISVGTELLLGDIINTDAQYLAKELAEIGITVFYQSTVGDNEQRLAELVQTALGRSDVLITTGGLGPTKDDLTKEVVCKAIGAPLEMHMPSLERMKDYFKKTGREMNPINEKQAMLPVGCTVLQNDFGTAPGCMVEKDGKTVILLPGPPRELKPMFANYVKPHLAGFSGLTFLSSTVHVFGLGESSMASMVSELLDSSNPTVAPYAKDGEALLRVTASGENEAQCREKIKPVVDEIRRRLGKNVYGVDCGSLQARVVSLLKQRGMKVATAESCTAGLLSKRITEVSGASDVFECGIISYANEIKMKYLGVPEQILSEYGAVSAQTARAMARGARLAGNADLGISITGIAGPGGGTQEKPVGLAYAALSDGERVWVKKILTGKSGAQNREYNRYVIASHALDMLRQYLCSDENALNSLQF